MSESAEEPRPSRFMLRRQVSKLAFEFVDDADNVLGTAQAVSWISVNVSVTTTSGATYRSRGSRLGNRLCDESTGDVVLGGELGWRLPDGRQLQPDMKPSTMLKRMASGRAMSYFDLNMPTGDVAVALHWLSPTSGWCSRRAFPFGRADLCSGLVPQSELVPLVAYAFHRFQWACQAQGRAG